MENQNKKVCYCFTEEYWNAPKFPYKMELRSEDGKLIDCMIIYATDESDAQDTAIDCCYDEVDYYELSPATAEDFEEFPIAKSYNPITGKYEEYRP